MAIDYVIDYECIPKQMLTTEGIIERLKGQERAQAIIKLYRQQGDDRPPSQMGFELTRSTPDGENKTEVVIIQDLLNAADELKLFEHHCEGCPANRKGEPFGCTGFIQYPISSAAEVWLLEQLPVPDEPLVWLLLKSGIEEFGYDGATVRNLRESELNEQGSRTYFEEAQAVIRRLGELQVTGDQVMEMVFGVGNIIPNHAGILLLFFHAINRDLEAEDIRKITPAPPDAETQYPFIIQENEFDDTSLADIKNFLHALYVAWTLHVRLIVDS